MTKGVRGGLDASFYILLFTALLLRRKYLRWRCALACERLRCEPWRPWGWGFTARDGLCGKANNPTAYHLPQSKPSAPAQRLAAPVLRAEAAPRPAPCTRPAAGTASPHN